MLNTILKFRSEQIEHLHNQGFIQADIARYFEIAPSDVAKILGPEAHLSPEAIKYSQDRISDKLKERDIIINKISSDLELYRLGFYWNPSNNHIAEKIATDKYGPESDDEEYNLLFTHQVVWKARNISGHQSSTAFNRSLQAKGFDSDSVIARSKKYNKIMSYSLYWELYANGFSIPEIVCYIRSTNETKVCRVIAFAKEYGIEKNSCEKNIEKLLMEGHKDKTIASYLGITAYLVSERKKSLLKQGKVLIKNLKRQEFTYHLSFEKNMSQTEIAEYLNVTRGTVISDLREYLLAHPEKQRHDPKFRYVPLDSTHTSTTANVKDQIIALRLQGHSVASIVKNTQVKEHAVQKLISAEENTPGTELYIYTHNLQQQVEELKREGKSLKETARILSVKGQRIRKWF